jgi:hypothetical protein
MEKQIYWSPYGSSWTNAIPNLSRLEILERELGADAAHPIRRLFVGLTMMLAPIVVVATVIGIGLLAR